MLFCSIRIVGSLFGSFYRCSYPSNRNATCVPVSEVSGRQHLRLASRRELNIPRFRRSTFSTLAFSLKRLQFGTHSPIRCVIRPSSLNVWCGTRKRISLPDIWGTSALEVSSFHVIALYIYRHLITHLLTYWSFLWSACSGHNFNYFMVIRTSFDGRTTDPAAFRRVLCQFLCRVFWNINSLSPAVPEIVVRRRLTL